MRISEIFYSIQGEGLLVGMPSVFVRVSGCNLRCTWCDTPYTSWQPEGAEQTVEQIVRTARSFPARHAVVTGGEPMIAPSIGELTQALREAGLHITIETAGTVATAASCDLLSISPKLRNSIPLEREGGRWASQHDRLRYQPEVLRELMARGEYQLKFVVESARDMEEIQTVCAATGAKPERVVLMPEGITRDTLRERGLWLAELCKESGYRFSPRLHVELWGNERGR